MTDSQLEVVGNKSFSASLLALKYCFEKEWMGLHALKMLENAVSKQIHYSGNCQLHIGERGICAEDKE